ncbi:MAG: sigma-70 family RNA polymerase sigma factor [Zavarzinella sp.]
MGNEPEKNDPITQDLLHLAAKGDQACLGELLNRDRDRLRKMIILRLDPALAGRVDPSDIIQEAQLEATRRLPEYVNNPTMPFFLWLRLITGQNILRMHRVHLIAQQRDARMELSLYRNAIPEASSAALAANLAGKITGPLEEVVRAEIKLMLTVAINSMDEIDREVLVLKHFEQLSTSEVATELNISLDAAKKRHIRAIKRLKEILDSFPGGLEG